MDAYNKKLAVGFIAYEASTAKYLPQFLASLKNQSLKNFTILAIDNSSDQHNENSQIIEKDFREIKLTWAGKNLGFAVAYNIMIRQAIELGAEYFLALNPDMILEEDTLQKLLDSIEKDAALGSVSPKILRWDFKNSIKTRIIDTCGIIELPGLQFSDLGQAKIDRGQFNNSEILGPSGAAGLFRISSLIKIKEDENFFDELMFMYKEDCDLAYRLKISGFKSKLVPEAIIYHDRTATSNGDSWLDKLENRKNKSRKINNWSFLHQQIIFCKFWRLQNGRNKFKILIYQAKAFLLALFFERYLLKTWLKIFKIRKSIKHY